jgi:RHS repeat-associated protein
VAGQVTGLTLGNGVAESYGYDSQRLQLTSQSATKSGNTLLSLTYNYQATAGQNGTGTTAGNSGQLMSVSGAINGTTESTAYTYDLQGRLTTSNQASNTVTAQRRFQYDRWGNRTGVWDAVSGGAQIQSTSLQQSGGAPTNRITGVSNPSTTLSYSYDATGNVTSDGVHSYTYDSENRLVSVDAGASGQYSYDHQNRRWKKAVGQATTHYVWQGSQVIAEHNGGTGAILVDYIYSGGRMIAKVEAGVTRYFLSDRLSVRLMMDASGNVIGRQGHLPYGEDFAESGTQQKQHLTSYEREAESGLDYAINRSYSNSVGRFNQADPYRASGYMTNPQSWNRYAYVHSNPINNTDRLGRDIDEHVEVYAGADTIEGSSDWAGNIEGRMGDYAGGKSKEGSGASSGTGAGVGVVPSLSVIGNVDFENLMKYIKKKMSENCKNWLKSKGMQEFLGEFKVALDSLIIDYRSDFANTKMDLDGFHFTWREWFDRVQNEARQRTNNPNTIVAGLTVTTPDFSGAGNPHVYPIIILGPAYYDGNELDAEGRAFVNKVGGLANYQAITLLHELFHVRTGKRDGDMERELGINGTIDDFLANDCKQ